MGVEVAKAAVEEMSGCVCFALRKTARAVTQFYDRALKKHRLRVTQLSILVGASRFGAVPLVKLAEVLGMDRTTLLRNVRPLVKRRLLEVELNADSRKTEIRSTAGGRALLAKVYPAWRKAQDQALQSLEGSDWSGTLQAVVTYITPFTTTGVTSSREASASEYIHRGASRVTLLLSIWSSAL